MLERESDSFWRENVIAVVILPRVNCFSENIVVATWKIERPGLSIIHGAETSYQMLEVLSFCDRERRQCMESGECTQLLVVTV